MRPGDPSRAGSRRPDREACLVCLSPSDAAGVREKGEDDTSTLREEVAGLGTKLSEMAEDCSEGLVTREQLRSGSTRLRERLEGAEALLVQTHAPMALQGLPTASEMRSRWRDLGMDRQRAVIDVLMEKVELRPGDGGLASPIRSRWSATGERKKPPAWMAGGFLPGVTAARPRCSALAHSPEPHKTGASCQACCFRIFVCFLASLAARLACLRVPLA